MTEKHGNRVVSACFCVISATEAYAAAGSHVTDRTTFLHYTSTAMSTHRCLITKRMFQCSRLEQKHANTGCVTSRNQRRERVKWWTAYSERDRRSHKTRVLPNYSHGSLTLDHFAQVSSSPCRATQPKGTRNMTRKNEVLTYRTEQAATRAMRRLLVKYPVHPDCCVDVVSSPHWLYPFKYLIRVTGRDNRSAYWSRR